MPQKANATTMANKPYGSVNLDTGEIKVNKSMNRNGIEYLDTVLHETAHFNHPKMSEKEVEDKAMKDRLSILSVI